jgi:hypothetical protein
MVSPPTIAAAAIACASSFALPHRLLPAFRSLFRLPSRPSFRLPHPLSLALSLASRFSLALSLVFRFSLALPLVSNQARGERHLRRAVQERALRDSKATRWG